MEKNKKKFRLKVGVIGIIVILLISGIMMVSSTQDQSTSSSSSKNTGGGSSAPHSWEVRDTMTKLPSELPEDKKPEENEIKLMITGP